MKRFLLIVSLFICSITTVFCQKFSKVKFYPPSETAARNEVFAVLELDHFYAEDGGLVSEISTDGIKYLKQKGIRFEIIIDDVAADFQKSNRPGDFAAGTQNGVQRVAMELPCATAGSIIKTPLAFTPGSMGGYYTYAEMNAKMDSVVAAYPAIATKFSIGTTYEGRPIWCIKMSDNVSVDDTGEAEVLYTGLQHAREAISGTSLIFFMQYLAENYAADTRIADLVNNREIYIVPCANPDGYEYNRSTNPGGGGLWRKNRRLNSGGSYGVDLNRNWGIDWANCSGATSSCGSSTQSSDTYWGTSAFSEPETAALKAFVTSHNIVLGIDQHCYGPYYSLPFGRPGLHTMSATDSKFYAYTAALMGKYNCHRAGNSPQTVGYEVAGSVKDWMLLGDIGTGSKGKIYGLTGEAGGGAFWAPTGSIVSLSKGLCFQNLQAAYVAGAYYEVQDVTDLAITSVSGTFSGAVRRIGLSNEPATLSLIPIENIESVSGPVVIDTLQNYNDNYTAPFTYTLKAAIVNGQQVRFAWKVESGGYTVYDTVTKFYNPVTLLYDNMEGSLTTNWTATASPKTTNGWNFSTSGFYGGTKSLTESPAGNYTHSSTRQATYKNAINLSDATAAYLSFWVKHRSENCLDKLRIQVSTDGGTTYSSVCGLNTISESEGTLAGKPALTGIRENWTRELVNLSAYTGKSNIKFRFEFTSNASNTSDSYYAQADDGFYIDNLQIIKTTAALATRVNPAITLNAEVINNTRGLISWEAVSDMNQDYFVIEKSTGGQIFKELTTVRGFPPYQVTDEELNEGYNIYRVKHVAKSGGVTYSKTIDLVKTAAGHNFVLLPNPVKDVLTIQFNSSKAQPLRVQVTDMMGRILYSRNITATGNVSNVSINTSRWVPQVFLLQLITENNEVASQKFIKQ